MKAKPKTEKTRQKKSSVKRKSKPRKIVDDVLVKISPKVQQKVDHLIGTLNDTKEARMGDLKWLAGQILLRSREISSQLKSVRPRLRKKSKAKKKTGRA